MARGKMPRLVRRDATQKKDNDKKLLNEILDTHRISEAERIAFEAMLKVLSSPNGKLTSAERRKVVVTHFDLELGNAEVENLVSSGLIPVDEPIETTLQRVYRVIPERFRHPLAPPGKTPNLADL